MCNDNEEWWKIWRGTDLSFQNWHKEFDEFWLKSLKTLKNLHFKELLLTKVHNVWAEKVQRTSIFHDTRVWCKIWRKNDLRFGKWHEEFGKFSPVHKKVSKLGPFIQSRKYMSFKLTGELYVMTTKNDAKLGKELTCQFKTDMTNLTYFNPSIRKSQKFALSGLLLTKVYNAWA